MLLFADSSADSSSAKVLLTAAGFTRVVDSGEWSEGTYEAAEKLKSEIISGNDVMSSELEIHARGR